MTETRAPKIPLIRYGPARRSKEMEAPLARGKRKGKYRWVSRESFEAEKGELKDL